MKTIRVNVSISLTCINRLFAYCKGGNFNIYIWAWFGYFIRYTREIRFFDSKGYPFKNIFDFTTAGDWDCVAAVERLPALHYSLDFIFLSFGILGFIVEL